MKDELNMIFTANFQYNSFEKTHYLTRSKKKIVEKNIFGAKSFMPRVQKNEIIADKVSVTFSGLIILDILKKNIILKK